MFRRGVYPSLLCAIALSGCVTTPPLERATGSSDSPIMIKDVVQRVKCEISDAFDKKTEEPQFFWLASWTAKVDLTLTINEQAGVSPSGSYTNFIKSAKNLDAQQVPIPLVSQFFTFGAAANLSGQATRTETVSFTLALDELKRWRRQIDRIENDPSFPKEKRTCHRDGQIGAEGDLGLKEWVDSAFFPVESRDLEAGIHPQPLSQKAGGGGGSPRTSGGAQVSDKAIVRYDYQSMEAQLAAWAAELQPRVDAMKKFDTVISDSAKTIKSSSASLDSKLRTLKQSAEQYRTVVASYIKGKFLRFAEYQDAIRQYLENADQCVSRSTKYQSEVKNDMLDAANKLTADLKAEQAAKPGNDNPSAPLIERYKSLSDKIPSAAAYEKYLKMCADRLQKDAVESSLIPTAVPDQLDPPIDSVLHSVQFVVAYGASISPNWTLIQWRGPTLNQSLAAANGIRTHNLAIALGPRTGNANISQDALRLIQNQTVRQLGN